jgi:hypothetical protein
VESEEEKAASSERASCADCGMQSPPTSTDSTLISAQFGWRLVQRRLPDGRRSPVWRCPYCWRKFKAMRRGP